VSLPSFTLELTVRNSSYEVNEDRLIEVTSETLSNEFETAFDENSGFQNVVLHITSKSLSSKSDFRVFALLIEGTAQFQGETPSAASVKNVTQNALLGDDFIGSIKELYSDEVVNVELFFNEGINEVETRNTSEMPFDLSILLVIVCVSAAGLGFIILASMVGMTVLERRKQRKAMKSLTSTVVPSSITATNDSHIDVDNASVHEQVIMETNDITDDQSGYDLPGSDPYQPDPFDGSSYYSEGSYNFSLSDGLEKRFQKSFSGYGSSDCSGSGSLAEF